MSRTGENGTDMGALGVGCDAIDLSLSDVPQVPIAYTLYQNYPNPFNPVTNIKFSLPENQKVSLGIYSVTGRLVETLVNENRVAGFYTIQWNAGRHASGVYFYRLDAGVNSKTQKMILLK